MYTGVEGRAEQLDRKAGPLSVNYHTTFVLYYAAIEIPVVVWYDRYEIYCTMPTYYR